MAGFAVNHERKHRASYPPGHKVGMKVPKGGSDCAKCEYVKLPKTCRNTYFQKWHGSDNIPAPVDEYCCDYFESKG